jgi:hypothetical protein
MSIEMCRATKAKGYRTKKVTPAMKTCTKRRAPKRKAKVKGKHRIKMPQKMTSLLSKLLVFVRGLTCLGRGIFI